MDPRTLRPFLGAWAIWLLGYVLLLAADLVLRRLSGAPQGVSPLLVMVTVTIVAGAAAGFFLAAGAHWRLRRRIALLALQVPFAYTSAVTLGFFYLCTLGAGCP